jgi:hypothetical protein
MSHTLAITLTPTKFDDMARRLMAQAEQRTMTTSKGQAVGLSMARQLLAQSLFSTPYESLKTQFSSPATAGSLQSNAAPAVLILHYGSDAIITVNGKYTHCLREQSFEAVEELHALATTLAEQHHQTFGPGNIVHLPALLNEDWQYTDVIALARYMGYFLYAETVFDFLTDDQPILLNGQQVDCHMPQDWAEHAEIEMANIDNANALPIDAYFNLFSAITAWDTLLMDDPSNTVYHFSLEALASATYEPETQRWCVRNDHMDIVLQKA